MNLSGWAVRSGAAAALAAWVVATDVTAQAVGTTGSSDPHRVVWADPRGIQSRDLFWGAGSADRAPNGPFTFTEENTSGTQPKLVVTDRQGVKWDVKFGPEAQAEVAANRLVHAAGYFTEEVYLVASGQLHDVPRLERASEYLDSDGRFAAARFRRRDTSVEPVKEEWTFAKNPFVGQRELSGLLILMTMLNNWDIRGPANNEVLQVTTPNGRVEYRYLVGDLGATFGRMGGRLSNRSKWRLDDYRDEGFIDKVEGGVLYLDYDGFDSGMDRVPLEHARWFASIISGLSHQQVRRAFEAAAAPPNDAEGFTTRFMAKIRELQAAVK